MILTEDIAKQNIIDCFNYNEVSIPNKAPFILMNYMDCDCDEDIKLECKRLKRDVKIDICLGEKNIDDLNDIPTSSIGDIASVKVFQKNINISTFSNYVDVYQNTILLVESLSSYIGSDVYLTNDDQSNYTRIISKCIMCSNKIAMLSRIGAGNTIIVGSDLHLHFRIIESMCVLPFKIIYDNYIQADIVIVGRKSTISSENGMHIFHGNNDFYIGYTGDLSKRYVYFHIR